MSYYWRINDGTIYGADEQDFMNESALGDVEINTLYSNTADPSNLIIADRAFLCKTLAFYGLPIPNFLAVLAGPEERAQAIRAELEAIDSLSIRPLRAALAGAATEADEAKLAELETRAAELRTELAAL